MITRKSKAVVVSAADVPRLSAEDMVKVFDLLKGATSVELKVMVPDAERHSAIRGMKFDAVESQPRTAYFFDTPDLALNKAGLVLRARRFQGGGGDTVVKLRPVDPATIDSDLRRSASFKVEVDSMPGGYVCSASMKGLCESSDVLDVVEGAMPLSRLLSKEQRAYYKAHAPAEIALDSLVPLGPTFLLKGKHQPKDFDRRVTVELWFYPDGTRIFELSTKAEPKEGFQVAAAFRTYLSNCGISVELSDDTKTKSALRYYSRQLDKAEPGSGND